MLTVLICRYISWLLLVCTVVGDGITLAPLYWNASNPTFKPSRNSFSIDVNLYDQIDVVCPFYQMDVNETTFEYYVIYKVSKQAHDSCSTNVDTDQIVSIVNCSNPLQRRRFTMLFSPFQAIPNAPEFHPGTSHYFITTSTGRKEGIANAVGGACYYQNLKLIVNVCCPTAAPSVTNGSTTLSSTKSAVLNSDSASIRPSSASVNDQFVSGESRSSTEHTSTSTSSPVSTTSTTSTFVVDIISVFGSTKTVLSNPATDVSQRVTSTNQTARSSPRTASLTNASPAICSTLIMLIIVQSIGVLHLR